jgi:hypothetical protein
LLDGSDYEYQTYGYAEKIELLFSQGFVKLTADQIERAMIRCKTDMISQAYGIIKKEKYTTTQKEIAGIGLYTLFSVFTTFLFWGVQLSFKIYLNQEYLGLVLGLGAGYTIKFFLDKHFVFANEK